MDKITRFVPVEHPWKSFLRKWWGKSEIYVVCLMAAVIIYLLYLILL